MTAAQPRHDRTNPFIAQRIRPGTVPYIFPDGVTADQLIAALGAQGWRGAIIGPHGSGKSTLLCALRPVIEELGQRVVLVELHDGQRQMPRSLRELGPLPNTLVVVDGYEQLSWWSKLRLRSGCWRNGCGLLVTAHRPVWLPTLLTTTTDPKLAVAVVRALESGRPETAQLAESEIVQAYAMHAGNIREMLFQLYDSYRQRQASRHD